MEPRESSSDASPSVLVRRLLPAGPPRAIAHALVEASRRVLRRRFRVVLLIRDAYEHMAANTTALGAVWKDLQTVLRLLIAWVGRSYRQVSWTAVVLLVAALVYFVTPIDILPDTLGVIGFTDDVAVIHTAVEAVRDELDRFRDWEDADALPE